MRSAPTRRSSRRSSTSACARRCATRSASSCSRIRCSTSRWRRRSSRSAKRKGRDAQRRGVEVLPPHINRSEAKCALEDSAVRVGLGYVQAVGEADAEAVADAQPYRSLGELARRSSVKQDVLEALVAAGTCDEWG